MRTVFDIEEKRKKLKELEKEIQNPSLWQDKEKAIKISQEIKNIKKELEEFDELEIELELLNENEIEEFKKKIKQKELQTFLSGKYDKGYALLSIYAGAGGKDSQDWATMLLRMYERYCLSKGFKTTILNQTFGEGGGPEGRIGTKSVTMEVKGNFAYGFLKKETGVHRLVRISPFSAQQLRHTSFALVEVLPVIEAGEEIKIDEKDLKVEFYRASGPGGQYVNKRESSVRVTHLPTGITVSCQSERLQGANRKKAMEILRSKLYQIQKEKDQKTLEKIKGDKKSASWGNQIRSYVLHPYKLVKDLRTDLETNDVEGVLDGNLDQFIEAEIRK